jgi:LAO/AO transport system kinase
MLAGAGDELQGIKKGIMEMADAVVINKADGDNLDAARKAELEYRRALHLFPLGEDGWQARTATCSALEKKGMSEVWQIISEHHEQLNENGFFQIHRKEQAIYRFHQQIDSLLKERFFSNSNIAEQVKELEKQVREGKVSPYLAAERVVKA